MLHPRRHGPQDQGRPGRRGSERGSQIAATGALWLVKFERSKDFLQMRFHILWHYAAQLEQPSLPAKPLQNKYTGEFRTQKALQWAGVTKFRLLYRRLRNRVTLMFLVKPYGLSPAPRQDVPPLLMSF